MVQNSDRGGASSSTIDSDGCKCCNCKKTRCLKLYCDFFAAGTFCAEPCACQGCSNRIEYEDTVLETRRRIESRHPLAFAPKIIQCVAEFQDDGNHFTLSSVWHKRGCNCKKSMSLKKYCACYQANVGCSSGCRCESCKNVYGRKEDIVQSPEAESGLTIVSSYAKSSRTLNSSDSNEMLLETSKEIMDVDSFGQGRDCCSADMADQFSSICQSLADSSDFPPLLDFPSKAMVSLASSKATGRRNVSRIQLSSRSDSPSSGGSLRWRSSPVTAMTQLVGTKGLQALDSDSRLNGILEDDTPEVLKVASTPH